MKPAQFAAVYFIEQKIPMQVQQLKDGRMHQNTIAFQNVSSGDQETAQELKEIVFLWPAHGGKKE
jgi:hypothetical protein